MLSASAGLGWLDEDGDEDEDGDGDEDEDEDVDEEMGGEAGGGGESDGHFRWAPRCWGSMCGAAGRPDPQTRPGIPGSRNLRAAQARTGDATTKTRTHAANRSGTASGRMRTI